MGKTLKYVSEFTFPSDQGYSGSSGKTMVKGYARGGAADMAQDKAVVKAAVQKHERAKHPGKPLTKLATGGLARDKRIALMQDNMDVRSNPFRGGGGSNASGPQRRPLPKTGDNMSEMRGGPNRRGYPVNRGEPMIKPMPSRNPNPVARISQPVASPGRDGNQRVGIAMAKGGMTSKQQAKVGRVMGEFKAGELHSGKDGPVVRNRKQAVAIAMSEGRKAGKK